VCERARARTCVRVRCVCVCVLCSRECVCAHAFSLGAVGLDGGFAHCAAWQYVRSRVPVDGMIPADQFHRMIDKVFCLGLTDREVRALILAMDTDKNGAIDFQEFQAIVMPALAPNIVAEEHCTGLPISKSIHQEQKSRGKGSHFHYDTPVSFNNKFRQTLDETGQPLLKNIFRGVFEKTDKLDLAEGSSRPEIVQQRSEGKRSIRPDNFEYSRELNVPMVQAVLQGSWYGEKSDDRLLGQPISKIDRDCIREHRRIINEYSQVVKSIKPMHRKSPPPSLRSGAVSPMHSTTSYFSLGKQLAAVGQAAQTFETSAEDVDNRYGLKDPKAAASMAQYLSGASPKEKQRYLKLVAKAAVNDPPSQALEYEARASGNRPTGPQKGTEGAFLRKTKVRVSSRPASSLGLIPRHQAISANQAQNEGISGELESQCVDDQATINRPASVTSGAMPCRQNDSSHESVLNEAIKFRQSMRSNARPDSALLGVNSALPRPATAMLVLGGRVSPGPHGYLSAPQKSHTR